MDYNRHHHNSAIPVVVLSACSNICGVRLDIPTVSTLIHEYNGVVAWDLAAIAAHDKVDMNPSTHPNGYIDFAFVSPHKLIGGPGSSGLLLCKKKRQTNAVPAVCGGGVVLYVSQRGHRYLDNFEEREEAGTPDILGCIRAGIVYHLHRTIGIEKIAAAEHKMADHLYKRLQTHSKIHILGPKASYTRTTAFDDRLRIVLTVLDTACKISPMKSNSWELYP
ncbi:Cysteine desulfurase, putative [Perkinsus marinus ATCC 50983]|uniref:Cysteine desulfurase, putative n=1 Tax=Perkinsus marinus (strain ATCC 50983 / TXsc) TaxID=423536 RepID=C5LVV2_PERM5|nr:Cysteine desulfurase, putative [Perkinsus marinus ATCC 50983]EEQ99140.1 Cysteine desulfurase, putative [Perkinsus marinus ATCC 50983]|eukprot:XP_002766423.1 Cysteine desulfurase, putative [Perkinsus marinus ATCC 50983]